MGPYGGELEARERGSIERSAPAIIELFRRTLRTSTDTEAEEAIEERTSSDSSGADAREIEAMPDDAAGAPAASVTVKADGDVLVYDADLSESLPLLPGGSVARARLLRALIAASRSVLALHASGRAHGDLRPETIRVKDDRAWLVVAEAFVDPLELLPARLAASAAPSSVAFAAPEVTARASASAASDVYSIAALAWLVLTDKLPLGRLEPLRDLIWIGGPNAAILGNALEADPTARPPLESLLSALIAAEGALGANEAGARATVDMGTPRSAASTILVAVLALGAMFVFAGVLALVVTNWARVGEWGRLGLLTSFTALVYGLGSLLTWRGFSRSGFSLQALSLQLGWAIAYFLLTILERERSYGAWAIASASVGALQCAFAARRNSMAFGGVAMLAFVVSAVTFGIFLSTGARYGPSVYAALIAFAYAAVAAGCHRFDARAIALPFAFGSMLWAFASAAAMVALLLKSQGFLQILFDLTLPYGLVLVAVSAASRLPDRFRTVARIAAGTMLLLVPSAQALALGDHLSATLAVSIATLGITCFFAVRFDLPRSPWAIISACIAGAWMLGSTVRAFVRFALANGTFGEPEASVVNWAYGSLWPYAIAALALGLGWLVARHARSDVAAIVCAGAISALGLAPTTQALLAHDRAAVLIAATLFGFVVLILTFRLRALEPRPALRIAGLLVGLAAAATATTFLTLAFCFGRGPDELLSNPHSESRALAVFSSRAAYLAWLLIDSTSLLALALVVTERARPGGLYRVVELTGGALFFGTISVLSLADARQELFYAAILLAGGVVVIAIGMALRHAFLVTLAALCLVVNLFIQYFAKLSRVLHWGLLAAGFGALLLALAIVYERKLKAFVPKLREWA